MKEWKEVTLSEICTDISYGYTESASLLPIGPKFLRITDIVPPAIDWGRVPYCKISNGNYQKYKLEIGDIVIARTGATTGFNKTIKEQVDSVFASYLIRYKIDKAVADPFYIGYCLQSNSWYEYVDAIAGGSAQPGANAKQLGSFEISLPPLPEQRAIASILSSLDDKIDLLHRQNATLEAMAEALFRQWFVVEAREEWEEISLLDAIELVGGGTPKTSMPKYWDGNICWLSGGDIASNHKNFVLTSEKTITELGLENSSAKLLPKYSTIISARGTVGKYCLLATPMTFSQSNYGIKPRYRDCYFFTYLLVAYCVEELQAAAYGSVFDTITTNTFKEHKIYLPKEDVILSFEEEVRSLFLKMLSNQTQIRTLTALRDTLLPKLMSGELRVKM